MKFYRHVVGDKNVYLEPTKELNKGKEIHNEKTLKVSLITAISVH